MESVTPAGRISGTIGAMVNAAVAFLAALSALGCGGLVVFRVLPDRPVHLLAWGVTLIGLGIALAAMAAGFATGFSPALLRTVESFGALVAPLTLVLGVVELIARSVQARFAARLIAASYAIVAMVIVLLDPIIGTFGTGLPKVAGHYSSLPRLVLDGGHVFAVVTLLSCVATIAKRGNRRDRQATEMMLPVALIALAGVLVVTATRGLLPGTLAPIGLGGAVALIWFGAMRLMPDPQDEEEAESHAMEQQGRSTPWHLAYPPTGESAGYGARPGQAGQSPQPHAAPAPQQPHAAAAPPPAPVPSVPAPSVPAPQAAPVPPASPATGAHLAPAGPPVAQPSFVPFAPPGQYGRITMYTLREGHEEEFDRLAAEVTRAVLEREPGILVYACHSVDGAPTQRIFYQLFRDGAAVAEHTRQPHVQRFAGEARTHVAATNVVELTVKAGKVGPPPDAGRPVPGGRPPVGAAATGASLVGARPPGPHPGGRLGGPPGGGVPLTGPQPRGASLTGPSPAHTGPSPTGTGPVPSRTGPAPAGPAPTGPAPAGRPTTGPQPRSPAPGAPYSDGRPSTQPVRRPHG